MQACGTPRDDGTLQWSERLIHRLLLGTLTVILPLQAQADIGDAYGQYHCSTTRMAGLVISAPEQPQRGAVIMPGSKLSTFYLTVEPIVRTQNEVENCKNYLSFYSGNLVPGQPQTDSIINARRTKYTAHALSFEITCTASTRLRLRNGAGEVKPYYTVDLVTFARGVTAADWFSLFIDGTFHMGLDYDNGPAVGGGICEKITPKPGFR